VAARRETRIFTNKKRPTSKARREANPMPTVSLKSFGHYARTITIYQKKDKGANVSYFY
jgi:hypothetical protein